MPATNLVDIPYKIELMSHSFLEIIYSFELQTNFKRTVMLLRILGSFPACFTAKYSYIIKKINLDNLFYYVLLMKIYQNSENGLVLSVANFSFGSD